MVKGEKNYSEVQRRADLTLRKLILFSIVVFAVQVLSGLFIYWAFTTWNDRADFGEMFGAVNTLFSGLAFAGVIYAILLQRRELELQRNELEMTREELRRSAEAQERSEEALSKQAQMMILSARLNAMSFIIEARKNKLEITKPDRWLGLTDEYREETKRIHADVDKLDALIEEIERAYPQPDNAIHPPPQQRASHER